PTLHPLEPPIVPYTTLFRSSSVHLTSSIHIQVMEAMIELKDDRKTNTSLCRSKRQDQDKHDLTIWLCPCTARQDERQSSSVHHEDRKSTRLNSSHVKISYAV